MNWARAQFCTTKLIFVYIFLETDITWARLHKKHAEEHNFLWAYFYFDVNVAYFHVNISIYSTVYSQLTISPDLPGEGSKE